MMSRSRGPPAGPPGVMIPPVLGSPFGRNTDRETIWGYSSNSGEPDQELVDADGQAGDDVFASCHGRNPRLSLEATHSAD
jgi:hypothetical protein